MSVRISTLGVPLFRLHDLEINEQWLEVEKLTEKQRASLIAHTGRFVRVHPSDVEKLGKLGLALVDGKVVEAKKSNPKPTGGAPDASGKSDAKKES